MLSSYVGDVIWGQSLCSSDRAVELRYPVAAHTPVR